ncbi:MAG: tetratricopeptide repeat protein [Gelidibacter sp.]|nr:tetratricopeptide repeat protein [Gelidibacter sp.]
MPNSLKVYYILIGVICFGLSHSYAQDETKVDSLKQIYDSKILTGEEQLDLIHELSFHSANDVAQSIAYANELISLSEQASNMLYLYRGYSQKGQTYRMAGDITEALDAFFKASEVAQKLKDERYLGGGYLTIADTYSEIDNKDNAEAYYKKSIEILRRTNDSTTLATSLLNSGYHFYLNDELNIALDNYKESAQIFDQLDYPMGTAYNIGNIGMVYARQGKDELAMKSINQAIETLEEYEDYYAISEYLTSMSDVYVSQQKIIKAVEYDHKSLDIAKKYKLKMQISESNLSLHDLYNQLGDAEASLFHYKEHIAYRDSIINIETVNANADMRTKFEVDQEKNKVIILEQKRKNQRIVFWSTVGITILIVTFAFSLFKQIKFIKKANRVIATEKERSDKLLLNILPEETAQELKDNGSVVAKKYPAVTVLFSDFKGFTSYAEHLTPEKLVETIDHYFSKFDVIMEKHGLEKIKTIGDAYMAAGGLPVPEDLSVKNTVLAALEMQDFIVKQHQDKEAQGEHAFEMRVGVHTGPVVAGIVGVKKFQYDIWGDAVNTASRIESNGDVGKVNISEATYNYIKDDADFVFEGRGKVQAKGKGEVEMYFVSLA